MSAADELADWWVHAVTVETYQGTSAYGAIYAAPVSRACYIEGKRQLVRASDGSQVISETSIYGPADDAELFTAASRITFANSKQVTVITAAVYDPDGFLDLPSHYVVTTT